MRSSRTDPDTTAGDGVRFTNIDHTGEATRLWLSSSEHVRFGERLGDWFRPMILCASRPTRTPAPATPQAAEMVSDGC